MIRRATLLLMLVTGSTWAADSKVHTQGMAPLDNQSRGSARLQAIQDAQRKASEVPGLRITGSGLSDGLNTMQSRGDGGIGKTRVTGEKDENGLLKVDTEVAVNPAGGCAAAQYRKKLAVANFTVAHPEQVTDLYNAGQGFAMELWRRMESSNNYLLRNAVTVNLFPDPNLAPATDTGGDLRAITGLGQRLDAQFVVAGVILDLTTADSVVTRSANEATSLFGIHLEPYQRALRVALYVFDSLTGNTLLQQTFERTAWGDVYYTAGAQFNSREVQTSQLGTAVQEILTEQIAAIDSKLNCMPLMERIVRVDKPYVYFNAGSTSNVQVGDTLAVYHQLDKPLPGVYYQNRHSLGYTEELKTTLTVTQVQPSFSIGRLETESAAVSPMDVVRSW